MNALVLNSRGFLWVLDVGFVGVHVCWFENFGRNDKHIVTIIFYIFLYIIFIILYIIFIIFYI